MPIAPADFATRTLQQAGNAQLVSLAAEDFATSAKQDTGNGTLASILAKIIATPATAANQATEIASLATIAAKGTPSRKTLDWSAAPWDGVAAKKLVVRTGAGYVKVASLRITAGGGAGGCTTRTGYLCEVGQTTANATVETAAGLIAAQINTVLIVPRLVLADAGGEIDVYVVPDVGTTAEILYLDVESV